METIDNNQTIDDLRKDLRFFRNMCLTLLFEDQVLATHWVEEAAAEVVIPVPLALFTSQACGIELRVVDDASDELLQPAMVILMERGAFPATRDTEYEIASDGTVRIVDTAGTPLMEHAVEPGDVWRACEAPDGYAPRAGDCDDSDDEVNPSAIEVCNDRDDDCDDDIDEEDIDEDDEDVGGMIDSCFCFWFNQLFFYFFNQLLLSINFVGIRL